MEVIKPPHKVVDQLVLIGNGVHIRHNSIATTSCFVVVIAEPIEPMIGSASAFPLVWVNRLLCLICNHN